MVQQPESRADRPLVVRRMGFEFDPEAVPRWWFGDNPVATHVANGLHMVFPEGERFFIRSVRHYLDRIEDPGLRARVEGFFKQESAHGAEHQRSFEMLEAQGYDVRGFLHLYERVWLPRLERLFPPAVNLSVTVALEHLTASLGESALTAPFLDAAHPVMRDLLRWHACEEIEHKSVAFDVLRTVHPSYLLRVFGMLVGLVGLLTFWRIGARRLLRQEAGLTRADLAAYRRRIRETRKQHTTNLLRRAVLEYLRPSFHPDQTDNYHLAEAYLARIGRLAG